jgi:hypothetical protein
MLADSVTPSSYVSLDIDGIRQEWALRQYAPDLGVEGKKLAGGKSPDIKDGAEMHLDLSVQDRQVTGSIEGENLFSVKVWGTRRAGHVGFRGWCLKAPALKQAGVTCDSCCLYKFSGFDLDEP